LRLQSVHLVLNWLKNCFGCFAVGSQFRDKKSLSITSDAQLKGCERLSQIKTWQLRTSNDKPLTSDVRSEAQEVFVAEA
jgi:hypothetical protein